LTSQFKLFLGNLTLTISCCGAISRNSGNQHPQEEREKVNRYIEEKIDEVKSERISRFNAYLVGELHLADVHFQRSNTVTVKCGTLEVLEDLWHDYFSGHLNKVAEECLITEQVKEELFMETIKLKTTILEKDYTACKLSLIENAGIFFKCWNYVMKTVFCFYCFCFIKLGSRRINK